MQIKIGTDIFIGGNSKYQLESDIQGLDAPAIRIGDGVYAGRDGGFVSGHFYGQRLLTIPGFYIGTDCDDAANLRQKLMGAMRIRYKLPIIIQDFSGDYFYTEGFIKDVKSNITSPVAGQFQLTITCPDPILYKMTTANDPSSIYATETLSFQSGEATTTINIPSSVNSQVSFLWNGEVAEFIAENTSTSQSFALDSQTPSGDTVISFKDRLVQVDGLNYNSHRTMASEWWELVPGVNEIALTTTSANPVDVAIRWYKEGVAGI